MHRPVRVLLKLSATWPPMKFFAAAFMFEANLCLEFISTIVLR